MLADRHLRARGTVSYPGLITHIVYGGQVLDIVTVQNTDKPIKQNQIPLSVFTTEAYLVKY